MASIRQSAFNYTAAGQVGPWIPLDHWSVAHNAWYLVSQDNGANLSLQLDVIADDAGPGMKHQVMVAQSGTTITVTDNGPPLPDVFGGGLGHGLAAGDFVSLIDVPSIAGIYAVTSITSTTVYTLTAAVSQTLPAHTAEVMTGKVVPGLITGITSRQFAALFPWAWAIRLTATGVTASGVGRLVVGIGGTDS